MHGQVDIYEGTNLSLITYVVMFLVFILQLGDFACLKGKAILLSEVDCHKHKVLNFFYSVFKEV